MPPQQQNWGLDDDLKIIRIDADSASSTTSAGPRSASSAMPRRTLAVLADKLGKHASKPSGRAEHIVEVKATATRMRIAKKPKPQIGYLEAIEPRCPRTASWSTS